MSKTTRKRVCIVGCGPAGMSLLFQLGKLSDDEIPDIVCYEKQSDWGGAWNVTWRKGTDEYGEQLHSVMYYDLWCNDPKEVFEYPDYTYETHFGKVVPSYIPWSAARDYFVGRATRGSKRDLKQYVKFCTIVKRIDYDKETDTFTVIVKHLKEDKEEIVTFSHVIVAVGQFSFPNTPSFEGLDDFKGHVLHAKDVKHIGVFKGKRMLIIGSSYSAEDLSLQGLKYGVKSIIISYRTQPLGYKWPEGIEERPLVEKFVGNTAHFKDGSVSEIDVVLLCTGYLEMFPFLSEELRLKTPRLCLYPDNLYKGILWMNGANDKLMYVGIQYNIYCVNMFDAQAIFARKNIMGTLKLPPREEMREDIDKWIKVKDAVNEHAALEVLGFMTKYFQDIVKTAGYREDTFKAEEYLVGMMQDRSENICTWREKQYPCIYTGKLSLPPKIPWMKNLDVTLEDFLKQCSE